MFRPFVLAVIAAQALFVCADPNPTSPGPGDVIDEGSNCDIAWDADTSGTWTQMSIELMTGDNWNMVHLATVGTVDATKQTTFSYPCLQVTPNSAIYFYQFKSPSSNNTYWTTRFAIADASGATTPPTNSTQPNGDKISWGTGSIVGSDGSSTSSSVSSLLPSSSSTFSTISSASSPSIPSPPAGVSTSNSISSSSPVKSSNSAPAPSTSANGSTSNSNDATAVASRQSVVALIAVVAATFSFVF